MDAAGETGHQSGLAIPQLQEDAQAGLEDVAHGWLHPFLSGFHLSLC